MGTKKEFIEKVLDLISTSAIKMGLKPDAPTLAILSKEFASILITNNKLKTLAFEQVQEAFNIGLMEKENQFLSIPTFYRWCREHKLRIDHAYYQVHTLGENPKKVEYYKPIKLLKW